MIEFQKIRWKNFLSTGNNFTEVQLNRSSSTLILGTNGAGKSTILDALTFGLFGKPFRKINKPQLVNSVNEKDCLIEVEFKIGNKQYLVRRGIKPNKFEVMIDNNLVDQDSKTKDYQRYLEENILKLNFKSFTQTVILGSATFVPFMQLNANDRRDIIEDLLDIKIFTTMNDILKIRMSELKDNLFENEKNRELLDQKIDMQERYIDDAKKSKSSAIKTTKNKIVERETTIEKYLTEVENLSKNIEDVTKTVVDETIVKKKQSKLDSLESQLTGNVKKNKKDIQWFEEIDSCPTCKQSIDDTHKHEMIHDKKNKIVEIEEALDNLSIEFKKVNDRMNEITDIKENIMLLNTSLSEKNTEIRLLRKNIVELKEELKELEDSDSSVNELKTQLKEFQKQLKIFEEKRKELVSLREYYNVSAMLLKDTGVKTSIIKYYLPKMNKLINKYLREMDFYINFTMDEKFSENIKSRGRENFSYASFSEGEKMRIDLALLFTWRAVAKMKNSVNTNLLILDEVFDSSLDNSGTDEFLKLLNTLGGNNVFVISHKGEILYDKFHSVIKFDKVKNFSQIVEEK